METKMEKQNKKKKIIIIIITGFRKMCMQQFQTMIKKSKVSEGLALNCWRSCSHKVPTPYTLSLNSSTKKSMLKMETKLGKKKIRIL